MKRKKSTVKRLKRRKRRARKEKGGWGIET